MADINEKKKYSVLNNSYKTGEKLQGDNFEFYTSVKIDEVATSMFMKDCCDFDSIYYENMVNAADELMKTDEHMIQIIEKYDNSNIKKFDKDDINYVFERMYKFFSTNKDFKYFFNMAYVFDIVSSITNASCDVIFNALSYDNKIPVVDTLLAKELLKM